MSSLLRQAEALVQLLEPEEKVQLIQFIAPTLVQGTASQSERRKLDDHESAWQAYRKIGNEIAALTRTVPSSTQLVSDMRR